MSSVESTDSIREFWFGAQADDAQVAQQRASLWWSKNPETDQSIRTRFDGAVAAAGRLELDSWAETAGGLLALILLTDQFPRNIFRGTPQAFQYDALALGWCLSGLERDMDRVLRPIERVFFYLPLEHSESREHQGRSVQLFTRLFQEVPAEQLDVFRGYLIFALRHRRIIDRFGRFPHRNSNLGRLSTPEEIAFLQEPGSSF
jgi:uncharacterized protein (DUF924 family)